MSEIKWNPRSLRVALFALIVFSVLLVFNLQEYSYYASQYEPYAMGEAWTLTLNDTNFFNYILPFLMVLLFTIAYRFEPNFTMKLVRYSSRIEWQMHRFISRIVISGLMSIVFALLVQIAFIPLTSFQRATMSRSLSEFIVHWLNDMVEISSLNTQSPMILGLKSLFLYSLLVLLYFTLFDLFQMIYNKWKYFPSVSVLFFHAISMLIQSSNPSHLLPTPLILAMSITPLGIPFLYRALMLVFIIILMEIVISLIMLKKDFT